MPTNRDILGEVTAAAGRDQRIPGAMHHQRRHVDTRQDMANVDVVIDSHQLADRTGTGTRAFPAPGSGTIGFVNPGTGSVEFEQNAFT